MFNKTGCGIRIATKIGADVQVVCESVCANFDKKRITYIKVIVKIDGPKFETPRMAAIRP